MKYTTMLLTALTLSIGAGAARAAEKPAASDAKPAGKKKLVHVVAVKWKDGTTPAQTQAIADAFRALKKKIPVVKKYDGGESVSVEKLNKGFHHCSVLSFENIADLKTYIDHPDHKAFVELLKKSMADVFVFDFWE
jgi:hypothetical protein